MTIFEVQKDDKTCGIFDTMEPLLVFLYQYAKSFGFDDKDEDLTQLTFQEAEAKLNSLMSNAKVAVYELNCDYYAPKVGFRYGKEVTTNAKADQHFLWTAQMNDDTNYTVTAPYKPMAITAAVVQHINEHDTYSGVKVIERQ